MNRLIEKKLKLCFTDDGRLKESSNKDANPEAKPSLKSYFSKVDILKPKQKRQDRMFMSPELPLETETCEGETLKTAAESNVLPSISFVKSNQENNDNDRIRSLSNELGGSSIRDQL